ncbi:MAG: TonB-dependent receptor [Chlorobiaceae bacterium]|nr:TonB-dependent receptor [Chlorobiaceae bacterium]
MKNKSVELLVLAGFLRFFLFQDAAAAEQTGLYNLTDEVVVTATLSETPVSKIPAAVEIIGKEEIAESGAATLAEVLSEAQSLTLEPANGRQSIARLRGLSSRHTLVLVDGMRLTSGFQDYLDLSEIPSGMIERIEVVRGSGSALYGSDAVGGVINVITRKPTEEFQAGFTLRGGGSRYGEAGSIMTDGWLSGSTGKIGYVVSGTYGNKDRYDRDSSDLMTDGDDRILKAAQTALTCDLGSVKLAAGFNYADTELEGVRTQTTGDFNRTVDAERVSAYLGFDAATGNDSSLRVRAWHSGYDWASDMVPLKSGATTTTTLEQTVRQIEGRWTGRIAESHRVTAGLEYRSEKRTDGELAHEGNNFGSFIQDELEIGRSAGFVVGARYDRHSDFGSAFSPKVGLWFRLNDHLRLRGSYGKGFRAPTLFELYTGSLYTKKKIVYANPDLDAERSISSEIGADVSFGNLTCSATVFKNDMRDMIHEELVGYVKDGKNNIPAYELQNISRAMTRGIELTASMKLPYGLTVSDELTFLDSEDKSKGQDLLYVPDVTNTLKLAYGAERSGFNGNIRVVSVGKQWVENNVRADGYTLVNAYLAKKVSSDTSLFFGVDNIFNEDPAAYGNIGGAGSTGTCFYGGLTFTL